jgi:hypothetical protein
MPGPFRNRKQSGHKAPPADEAEGGSEGAALVSKLRYWNATDVDALVERLNFTQTIFVPES